MKSNMQIASELLERCKTHLENEEKIGTEERLLNSRFIDKLENGIEDMELGAELDSLSRELQKEREEFNCYARLLVKYLIKLELL